MLDTPHILLSRSMSPTIKRITRLNSGGQVPSQGTLPNELRSVRDRF